MKSLTMRGCVEAVLELAQFVDGEGRCLIIDLGEKGVLTFNKREEAYKELGITKTNNENCRTIGQESVPASVLARGAERGYLTDYRNIISRIKSKDPWFSKPEEYEFENYSLWVTHVKPGRPVEEWLSVTFCDVDELIQGVKPVKLTLKHSDLPFCTFIQDAPEWVNNWRMHLRKAVLEFIKKNEFHRPSTVLVDRKFVGIEGLERLAWSTTAIRKSSKHDWGCYE